MRLFPFDDPDHQHAAEMLPWFVNGSLSPIERVIVERHVGECLGCRQEIDNLRALQAAIVRDDSDAAATQAFRRLRPRIERASFGMNAARWLRTLIDQWLAAPVWLRGAVVAQLALIAVLAGALLERAETHYYHTLSTPAASVTARGDVIVVFTAGSAEQDIRQVLARSHARIVDGPTPDGAYTLAITGGTEQAALAQLRAERPVKFAEPAQAGR
ncbi:MAG: zf-HC2 domain-containing protein [Betaproteobacteria bacterium]